MELIKLMNILIIQFDRNSTSIMMHNKLQSSRYGSAKSPQYWGFGGKRKAHSPHLKPQVQSFTGSGEVARAIGGPVGV
jgi:hypothetical protein